MVSVVIPTHNRADRLGSAIQSVLNQTVADLEVIVVDDGSTDGTRETVARLRDTRLRYVYQEHAGACAARNLGVSLAKGAWIAFQDSDDLWNPRKLETQLRRATETGADVICCRMARREADGTVTLFPGEMEEGFQETSASLLGIGTQTLLCRREVFEAYPFDPAMPRLQEFEWLCRTRQKDTVYFLDEILVDYCPGTDTISASPEKLAEACALLLEKHPALLTQSPQTAQQLAGRLRLDAEAAFWTGNPAYRACLRQAAVYGGSREKRQALLDAIGLYPVYIRLRRWAMGQRKENTFLWRTLTLPIRALKRVKHTLEEIREAEPIRDFSRKRRNFGAKWAFKLALCNILDILTDYHTALYHRQIRRFCDTLFSQAACETAQQPRKDTEKNEPIPVWTLWWDGEASAPPCVKLCLDSQRKYFSSAGYAYHVLDKNNYAAFVKLEPHILEKFRQGSITVTHFSDILRAELLKTHGGLWIDATVYLSGPLNRDELTGAFFTNRKTTYPRNLRRLISAGRWTGYFIQTEPESPIAGFLSAFFRLYWQKFDALIDYYLIDYALDAACRLIPEVRKRMDEVPVNNERIFDLFEMRNEAYQPDKIRELFAVNRLHKLSHKYPYRDTDDAGRMTVWKWLWEESAHEV